MDWGPRITYLASTALKDRVVPFGIKDHDRMKHVCVIGKVGSGRAALLARMALQDIERGIGTLVLDANGNLGPMIMERLSDAELKRLIHLDAADAEYPFSWNIVQEFRTNERAHALFAEALPSVYGVPRSALTDFLATQILKTPDASILMAYHVLADDAERDSVFPPESEESKQCMALKEAEPETVTNMVENGRYLVKDTMVRNLVGQREGKFSLSQLAEGAIFILDVSRIRVFPTRVTPLVKLFTFALRARSGSGTFASAYMHDCLRYLSESDAEALMTDQTYALTLSDTVYRESDLPLREKALSKCGSVVSFSPHHSDVSLVERIFYPYVTPEELQGLETGEACVQLTIDSVRARPFFANALDLSERKSVSLQDVLVESRKKYTLPRTQVDQSFKKQVDSDKKKGGQPPFSDAFKNIFAKRDPSKALAPTGDKKGDPSKPAAETGTVQQSAQPAAPQTAVVAASAPQIHEIPEDELKQVLFAPLPA